MSHAGLDGVPLYTVALGRAAVGLGAYVAPGTTRSLCGLTDVPTGSNLDTTTRLFGIRDVVLGAAMLAPHPEARRVAVLGGAIVDTADALAMGVQWYKGELTPVASVVAFGGAALFAVLGWGMLWRHYSNQQSKQE